MPKAKAKSQLTKFRIMLRGGPADNKILDYETDVLPDVLWVPVPPQDISDNEFNCQWRVGRYTISDEEGSFDIQNYYDFSSIQHP